MIERPKGKNKVKHESRLRWDNINKYYLVELVIINKSMFRNLEFSPHFTTKSHFSIASAT